MLALTLSQPSISYGSISYCSSETHEPFLIVHGTSSRFVNIETGLPQYNDAPPEYLLATVPQWVLGIGAPRMRLAMVFMVAVITSS